MPELETLTKNFFDIFSTLNKYSGFFSLLVAIIALPYWQSMKKKSKQKIIEKSLGADFFGKETIERSTRYYVEPDCSNIDPAVESEPRHLFTVKHGLFDVIDQYIENEGDIRHILILADSGMGKTSFILNYYAMNQNKSKRKRQQIVLIPLGCKNPDTYIDKIQNKSQTILFLDAFDEDIAAIKDHKKRLFELMEKCKDFKRILITCRTQFFPKEEEIPEETGIAKFGPRKAGEKGVYVFYKLYLSPLSEAQVKLYLKRFYSFFQRNKKNQAFEIIKKIPNLKVRPMLLSHVPDIVNLKKEIKYTYELYEIMVKNWLERESTWVDKKDMLNFSERLAVDIFEKKELRQFERIPAKEVIELATAWNIKLDNWQITGRSLLNRDAKGNYKFAHRSIMEFLFVKRSLQLPFESQPNVQLTDLMIQFYQEIAKNESRSVFMPNSRLINSIGMEFVYITPGTFMMGSPVTEKGRNKNERRHQVTLSNGFFMQTTPVTQGQWKKIMNDNPSYFKKCGDDCPVEEVSWNDTKEFIKKLNDKDQQNNYRLPTEAEWEYAARAGTETATYVGEIDAVNDKNEPMLDKIAWYNENSKRTTHPVAKKKPNDWGLFDMLGNVWEWCEDIYGEYNDESETDPKGASSGSSRVVRGGSWHDDARGCRAADRGRFDPGDRDLNLGFRLLRIGLA